MRILKVQVAGIDDPSLILSDARQRGKPAGDQAGSYEIRIQADPFEAANSLELPIRDPAMQPYATRAAYLETDDPATPKTVLTLRTIIPQQLEITPTFVFWKQGEKPDAKTITVKVGKEFTVNHIKVTSSSPDFQTKVEEAGKGEFKIDVQPKETNNLVASTLTIQPEDSQKVFYATARITNAPTVQ